MEQEQYDLIVIGTGFAGLSAAIEAGEAGASVLLLEKMRAPGGNSIISDGGMAVAGSPLQKRYKVRDSPDLFHRDMMEAGMGLNHEDLVRTLTENSESAYLWLTEKLKVEFMDRVDLFGGHSVPRSHGAAGITGASIIKPMLRRVEELAIPIRLGCRVEELIKEGNRITGVLASKDYRFGKETRGEKERYYARRGVVLAAGGYGADVPFRMNQDPRLNESIDTTNKPFATAELLVEAMKKGAGAIQLSHIQLGPWASPDEKGFGRGPLFSDYIGFIYGILVNPDKGERFINEQSDRKILSDAILATGKPGICLSDEAAVARSGWDLGKALKKGVVKTFPDLSALAAHHHIPEEPLGQTVEAFNRQVREKGIDPWGRKLPQDALPIARPPYYAMRVWPKVHYVMGGLLIDSRARVLDFSGRVIPGLYSAGEMTGGVHGACRLGSCAITSCIVFGRIAGREGAGQDFSS